MLLLKYDITRKGQVNNKTLLEPKKNKKIEAKTNKEYKVKVIINSAVYDKQAISNQISNFYYLVL